MSIRRARSTLGGEQFADAAEPVQVRHAHHLVPLRLADGEDGLGSLVRQAEDDDVKLVTGPGGRIVDGPGPYLDGDAAERFLRGEVVRPMPADLLEVRPEHAAREPALAALPQAAGVPGVLEIGPDGAHHRVVEGNQRLRDPERAAVFLEHIWLANDQTAVLQDVQRVREVTRFPPDVRGDAAPGAVAFRDGGEHRAIQADVPQVGFIRQQVTRLTEQGTGRVKDGPRDPAVEVVRSRGCIVAHELSPVRGGAPRDGVHLDGQHRVLDAPELGGEPVIQRRDDQFQARPAA